MRKLIIFDLDGTLIDSTEAWTKAFQKCFKRSGVKVSKKKLIDQFGKSDIDIVKSLVKDVRKRKEILKYLYQIKESDELLKEFKLHKNTKKVLKKLKEKGYIVALATGNRKDFCSKVLRYFGLTDFFDIIITVDDVRKGKPDPEMLIKCLKQSKVNKEDAIFICDSLQDILAGKKAGIKCCLVTWGALKGRCKLADAKLEKLSVKEIEKKIKRSSKS